MKYQEFRDRFFKFGCVSIELIAAFYSVFDRHNLKRWTDSGYLIKLKRGLYAFSDWRQTAGIGEAMASRIYAPSYLSCEWVLARAGLIPESVVQFTSVTTLKTAKFSNVFGDYSYRTIKPQVFWGYESRPLASGLQGLVATPAKALLDLLYLNSFYNTAEEMEELRLDREVLSETIQGQELSDLAPYYECQALVDRVALLRKVYEI